MVLDGAHNLDGITKLKESVEHYFRYKKLVLIIGILSDKDVEKNDRNYYLWQDKIIAVTPNSYRGKQLKN